VYAGGYEYAYNENTQTSIYTGKLWENGVAQQLGASSSGRVPSDVYSVYVSASDVYAAGWERDSQGGGYDDALWKNGVVQSGQYGRRSVFVSGSDVYTAPFLQKNGVSQYLDLSGAYTGNTSSVFVSGNDVYVAGFILPIWGTDYSDYVACLYKNGIRQNLGDGGTTAVSVFVSGNDVYVAGNNFEQGSVILWKNGAVELVINNTNCGQVFGDAGSSCLFVK
jgi:hypothetical protein